MASVGSLAMDSSRLFCEASDERSGISMRPTGPAALAAGDVLAGKYELVGVLGAGGMGTVWRAHALALDIDVAVKVLRWEHGGEVAAERLLREARATAKLGHPAIVRALDFGRTDAGEPFLVMELLRGCSLAEWLDTRGRMPAAQAVQMLLPIADGLDAAHAEGIIHRDIKPQNLLVVPDRAGTYLPKIVDFGIAKRVERLGDQVLTQEGTVLGSLQYMPPEQADGLAVGEQADVWSLCAVLYELVTGRLPFEGQTLTGMLVALHAGKPTPLVQLGVGDPDLWAIIERGLKKPLAERWPTMRALGRALAMWAIERGTTTDATGASLEHHWLGRGSFEPQSVSLEAESVATAPTSPRAITFTQLSPPATPSVELAMPASNRISDATQGAYVTSARVVPMTPAPRRRTRLFGALIAMVAVPVLAMAGLHAHGRSAAPASGGIRALAAPVVVAEAVEPPPPPVPAAAPTPAPAAPSAVASAMPMTSARAPRLAPVGRSKIPSRAMPIPSSPDF
jgi:eukaryotic-like serine/threonine-protein kinase